jgi:hypothetical protein
MERPALGAMTALRTAAVLAVAFFFLGELRLLEDPVRAIVDSLPYAEMAHGPYACTTTPCSQAGLSSIYK